MKITVLMGGTSSERNVSLSSGIRIVGALRGRGHKVTALDPARGVISEASSFTTGAVFDPHEVANVLGIEGIRWVMA